MSGRFHGRVWRVARPALRVALPSSRVRFAARGEDREVVASVTLGGRNEADAAVLVLLVVPSNEPSVRFAIHPPPFPELLAERAHASGHTTELAVEELVPSVCDRLQVRTVVGARLVVGDPTSMDPSRVEYRLLDSSTWHVVRYEDDGLSAGDAEIVRDEPLA